MKARKKSWHAWMYNFTYTSGLPNNLCPYFWKVLFSFPLFIPNSIIQLPALVANLFYDEEDKVTNCKDRRICGGIVYFALMIASLFLYGNFHLIKATFSFYSYNSGAATFTLLVDALILICVLIFLGCQLYENIADRNRGRETKPSLVKEFIKAKYNNYCPKIDWEE